MNQLWLWTVGTLSWFLKAAGSAASAPEVTDLEENSASHSWAQVSQCTATYFFISMAFLYRDVACTWARTASREAWKVCTLGRVSSSFLCHTSSCNTRREFGFGLDSILIGFGFGLDLVWIWFEFGLDLVWIWFGFGLNLVWIWFGFGLVWLS